MTTYAIGDVQGCYAELMQLLEKIQFSESSDALWFVGDLVNRGPDSLAVLRLLVSLKKNIVCVLGNHDFHLLTIAAGYAEQGKTDTLGDILKASDRDELLAWLVQQPLLHHDATLGYTMTHAGIAPQWNLAQAIQLADEVQHVLLSEQSDILLQHLYGNKPDKWSENLTGYLRWRCIINYFTRMRFCKADGSLDLTIKESAHVADKNLIPWYQFPERKTQAQKIIFGHWAALNGVTNTPNVFALDTGCVWGGKLTAMNLQTQELTSVAGLKNIS